MLMVQVNVQAIKTPNNISDILSTGFKSDFDRLRGMMAFPS